MPGDNGPCSHAPTPTGDASDGADAAAASDLVDLVWAGGEPVPWLRERPWPGAWFDRCGSADLRWERRSFRSRFRRSSTTLRLQQQGRATRPATNDVRGGRPPCGDRGYHAPFLGLLTHGLYYLQALLVHGAVRVAVVVFAVPFRAAAGFAAAGRHRGTQCSSHPPVHLIHSIQWRCRCDCNAHWQQWVSYSSSGLGNGPAREPQDVDKIVHWMALVPT